MARGIFFQVDLGINRGLSTEGVVDKTDTALLLRRAVSIAGAKKLYQHVSV